MRKKEENCCCEEGCPCGNPMNLGAILIAINLIISVAVLVLGSNMKVYVAESDLTAIWEKITEIQNIVTEQREMTVGQAGWEESYEKLKAIYTSEKYQSEQKDNSSLDSAYDYYVNGGSAESEEEVTPTEPDIYDESNYSSDKTYTAENMMDEVNNLLSSAPVRGSKDGRFVIIEYTELLCPYCQRHSQQGTINQVIEQFPGEVSSVSQHYLIHGTPALRLSAAMECIAETNPDVYHQIMEEAFASSNLNVTTLEEIAGNHGVDVEAMDACYKEGKYISKVYDMINMGSTLFGVSGTPGNVIVDKETGKFQVVAGAYPVDEFVNVINSMKNAQ